MSKSAVLFDLDGTLLNTAPDLIDSLNELLRRYQRPEVSINDIRHLLTHGSRYFITNFFNANATAEEIEQIRAEYLEIYSNSGHQQTELFPGMLELLQSISDRKLPWGIVTNKLTRHTLENLTAVRLPSQPRAIVCGDTLPVYKPNPEPLWHACELLHVSTSQVLYVGDSEVDAEAGLRAGIDTLIMEHGYHAGESTFANIQITGFIHDPKEVLKWL